MSGSVDHASEQLAQRIDDLLPQTQCRKCGYAGCKPYAQAIAAGEADINRCPPGGSRGIRRLAELLGREVVPLDTEVGAETLPVRAYIDEAQCIGCTLCLQACPVDAIVGAAKQMHTVIAAFCTGCELCLPPCPVDCITLLTAPRRQDEAAERAFAQASRQRYEERNARLERERQEKASRLAEKLAARAAQAPAAAPAEDRKRALVATAIARARARRRAPDDDGTDGRGDAG